MQTIWVVDDENNIRDLIRRYLEKEGFSVRTFATAEELKSALISSTPDMFILDIMLPGADGLTLCREIRNNYELPVIFVSARGEEFDRVLGLELGADDYLAKPFSPRELVVRVKNIFKRAQSADLAIKQINLDNLSVFTEQRKVTVNGEETSLTVKEFDLLAMLAAEPGRSFSRALLLEKIWGYNYEGDESAIDSTIKRVRKKLREKGSRPEISTVRGYGYRLDV
jgi:DNA-binding response OmpR family regulator